MALGGEQKGPGLCHSCFLPAHIREALLLGIPIPRQFLLSAHPAVSPDSPLNTGSGQLAAREGKRLSHSGCG